MLHQVGWGAPQQQQFQQQSSSSSTAAVLESERARWGARIVAIFLQRVGPKRTPGWSRRRRCRRRLACRTTHNANNENRQWSLFPFHPSSLRLLSLAPEGRLLLLLSRMTHFRTHLLRYSFTDTLTWLTQGEQTAHYCYLLRAPAYEKLPPQRRFRSSCKLATRLICRYRYLQSAQLSYPTTDATTVAIL